MMIVLAILLGGFFGFALYKVGAANMDNLISMLSFQNLTLMKNSINACGFWQFRLCAPPQCWFIISWRPTSAL